MHEGRLPVTQQTRVERNQRSGQVGSITISKGRYPNEMA